MGLKALSQISKFSAGDDLWAFPDIKNSKVLQNIDWFLNFQLRNYCDPKKQPTLVYSHKKLPTKGVLSIPYDDDPQSWCHALKKYWMNLGRPRLRVFAPDSVYDVKQLNELNLDNFEINVVLGSNANT